MGCPVAVTAASVRPWKELCAVTMTGSSMFNLVWANLRASLMAAMTVRVRVRVRVGDRVRVSVPSLLSAPLLQKNALSKHELSINHFPRRPGARVRVTGRVRWRGRGGLSLTTRCGWTLLRDVV